MEYFISWFRTFTQQFLIDGFWHIIRNFGIGIANIFNIAGYSAMFDKYGSEFSPIEWILSILVVILALAIFTGLVYLAILGIRKYVRYHRAVVSNEDLLRELSDLHKDVARLNNEKERLLALTGVQNAIPGEAMDEIIKSVKKEFSDSESEELATEDMSGRLSEDLEESGGEENAETSSIAPVPIAGKTGRFYRLSTVDEKYVFYQPPTYRHNITLKEVCEEFRNFACSVMHLYYERKTIRLLIAGFASTKMILLQGISGTGKTSLPYAFGKFLMNDATICSVQSSWRDRAEMFGYFNEFTKRFNETEFLRRIYDASYNDDINVIVLDEMNIARVEYYFAELLSILEMPDPAEWKLSLVPAAWPEDPKHLVDRNLRIPENVWYVVTAKNDDSTFAISDKVYDRAFTINLDNKGIPFNCPLTSPTRICYSDIARLYKEAIEKSPISEEVLKKIAILDDYVIAHFRVAFGNRILKQLGMFLPVYVACGGSETEGVDYLLATKVIRKFEGLNLSLIRDEIDPFIEQLDNQFGKGAMVECIAYLKRLRKMY